MRDIKFLNGMLMILLLSLLACHPYGWDEPPRLDPDCPRVVSILPTGATVGTPVTVMGEFFDPARVDQFTLTIGSVEVEIRDMPDENTLSFEVPEGINSGEVRVLRNCQEGTSSNGVNFTYYFSAESVEVFAGISGDNSVFNSPRGLDVDKDGNVIVADRNHHVIQRINSNGNPSVLAGRFNESGFNNDPLGTLAQFKSPGDVVVDPNNGNIYVADETNQAIRVVGASGDHGVSLLTGQAGEPGGEDGNFSTASFTRPIGLGISPIGNRLFVTEFSQNRLRMLDLNASNGVVTTVLGDAGGQPSSTELRNPVGVAFSEEHDPAFPILVADRGNGKIRAVNFNTKSLINVPENQSSVLAIPNDIATDDLGNVYVTEKSTKRVYAIFTDDTVISLAGADLNFDFATPSGIAIDKNRNILYVSDETLHIVVKIVLK